MNNGFITLHRKFTDWEWYTDANTMRLFIHLLIKANHAPKKWRGEVIERGQVLTGRIKLSDELHLSQQQIRTSMDKLKSTGEVTSKTTNKYSVVTLVKYSEYQDKSVTSNQQNNQQVTNKQPTSNQQVTTNNNVNNITIKQSKDIRHKHGEYKNVLLTDSQLEKLKLDFSNYNEMIKNLDEYIETTGRKYKNHNLVMRKWASNTPVSKEKATQFTREIDIESLMI